MTLAFGHRKAIFPDSSICLRRDERLITFQNSQFKSFPQVNKICRKQSPNHADEARTQAAQNNGVKTVFFILKATGRK